MCASVCSPRRDDLADKLAAGALPPERAAVAPQLIFNQRLDAWLAMLFTAILWFVILDMARICLRRLRGMPLPASSEAPYRASRLQAAVARGATMRARGMFTRVGLWLRAGDLGVAAGRDAAMMPTSAIDATMAPVMRRSRSWDGASSTPRNSGASGAASAAAVRPRRTRGAAPGSCESRRTGRKYPEMLISRA